MQPERESAKPAPVASSESGRSRHALEFLFVLLLAVVVLGAFVSAVGYDFISARAPLIIMVPLLILIVVQFNRTRKAVHTLGVVAEVRLALSGRHHRFRSVLALIGWMALLLAGIYVAGHYAGMIVFLFLLLRIVAGESLRLSIVVTLAVTASIYGLFEHVFNIELYRGLIVNMLASYTA